MNAMAEAPLLGSMTLASATDRLGVLDAAALTSFELADGAAHFAVADGSATVAVADGAGAIATVSACFTETVVTVGSSMSRPIAVLPGVPIGRPTALAGRAGVELATADPVIARGPAPRRAACGAGFSWSTLGDAERPAVLSSRLPAAEPRVVLSACAIPELQASAALKPKPSAPAPSHDVRATVRPLEVARMVVIGNSPHLGAGNSASASREELFCRSINL
jgi:hypothetical protein